MRRRLAVMGFLALWLGVAQPARAQALGNGQTVSVQDSGTACSVAFTCAAFTSANVANAVAITLQMSGTWTGTLTFEATNDGANWVSILGTNIATGAQGTTTTANGVFAFANVGLVGLRARATASMTGSAFVNPARGSASVRLSTFPTVTLTAFVFANIATVLPTNGMVGYCSDCTIANPCASGGSGAIAKRLNGVQVCN